MKKVMVNLFVNLAFSVNVLQCHYICALHVMKSSKVFCKAGTLVYYRSNQTESVGKPHR